ncbi:aspartate/glutamate racemase family protein [Phaeovibrio sulfidiphilus]|uniref:Aspartate/glutamate racemase family protein n=1 Tax=Phaeovibrio sulfidiphilus TaxID=1220600 RepID=A0A8J6YXQ2_9PROT|nr:aspartate/glutamate racemase family protein [Phaeovibrio sulfidiphilus]MBE1236518.1 aspartate/glutamate racemase family protein [Phaeovibrio sulfidiphilus]
MKALNKPALIGLIGGLSWASTATYYREINTVVGERRGGLHSARCLIHSVDFQELAECQSQGRWDDAARILADAARSLESGGADFFLLCTNTMHKVADALEDTVSIPFLHIADATAAAILTTDVRTVGLLGTRYTMELGFYADRLKSHGLTVLVPEADQRRDIDRIIFEELCRERIEDTSRDRYREVIADLNARGAEGVILGCTEIGLLIGDGDSPVPLFDTARIHARMAALKSLASCEPTDS